MKLFVILTVATLALGDKLDRTYLPASSRAQTAGGSGNILQTPLLGPSFNDVNNRFAPIGAGASNFGNGFDSNGFGSNTDNFAPNGNGFSSNEGSAFNGLNSFERPERPQAAFERTASILRQYNSNDGETYAYGFETENGITAEESGVATNGVQAKGSYSYIGDDGQVYSVTYTADENGYVPQGAHIPTAPPVPEEILKALEQNARDEAAGIFDDGSYDALKYGDASMPKSFAPSSFNGNNVLSTGNTFTDDAIVTDSALFLDNDTIRPPGYKNKGKNGRGQVQTAQPQPTLQGPAFQPINGFQPSSNVQPTAPANFRPQADLSGNKAYLPPRRNSGRNGVRLNARRPNFDERTGYNY